MPQGFDSSSANHQVIDVKTPDGHAYQDQKLTKMGTNHIGAQFATAHRSDYDAFTGASKQYQDKAHAAYSRASMDEEVAGARADLAQEHWMNNPVARKQDSVRDADSNAVARAKAGAQIDSLAKKPYTGF